MATQTEQQITLNQTPFHPESNAAGPDTLDSYLGQTRAVEQMRIALDAWRRERAAGRPHAFPHVGAWGPPGVGKTQLARVLAKEMKASLVEVLGCSLTAQTLHQILVEAKDDSLFLIDEADETPQEAQSVLLRAVEERVLFLPRANGQVLKIPLARFTLMLASNRMQQVLPALRDRLQMNLSFDFYDPDVLGMLTGFRAEEMGWAHEIEAVWAIGRCARGTPRQALRLLAACWRVAAARGDKKINYIHFEYACDLEGIEPVLGLDVTERAYLRILSDARSPVRPSVLAARLALPLRQITEVVEAFLLRQGLICRLAEGRELTNAGRELFEHMKFRARIGA